MAYLILRDDSPNVAASYRTKMGALAAIRRAYAKIGEKAVLGYALAHSPARGGITIIAEDEAMARLAVGPTLVATHSGGDPLAEPPRLLAVTVAPAGEPPHRHRALSPG